MTPATPLGLARPSALVLTRIEDRMSFVYLDRCSVQQSDNGTVAVIVGEQGVRETQLPIATLTTLLLGPGTSITQAAVASLGRAGCGAVFVGAGLVRSYGAFLSPYAPAERLVRQATMVVEPERRLAAAQQMYMKRFPGIPSSTLADATIEQLRGIEGIRMRGIYAQHSAKARLRNWRRNTGTEPRLGPPDPVNLALNAANSALYGIVTGVVTALGMSPGLGVIHTGNRLSFVLDIADLYKTRLTIPLAFALKEEGNPSAAALRRLRHDLKLVRLIPEIVSDIDDLLGIEHVDEPDDWEIDELRLWGPQGDVEANWSHAAWTDL